MDGRTHSDDSPADSQGEFSDTLPARIHCRWTKKVSSPFAIPGVGLASHQLIPSPEGSDPLFRPLPPEIHGTLRRKGSVSTAPSKTRRQQLKQASGRNGGQQRREQPAYACSRRRIVHEPIACLASSACKKIRALRQQGPTALTTCQARRSRHWAASPAERQFQSGIALCPKHFSKTFFDKPID
jgi:hypothetical protein